MWVQRPGIPATVQLTGLFGQNSQDQQDVVATGSLSRSSTVLKWSDTRFRASEPCLLLFVAGSVIPEHGGSGVR